jgi:hypothetical protein
MNFVLRAAGGGGMRKYKSVFVIIIFLSLFAGAQDQQDQKRPPSTPEERKRFIALVHKLEKTPLDSSLNSEVSWALQWLQDIPDVNVTICFDPLGPFVAEQYSYGTRIRGQFVLGMGAFLIEHPQKTADVSATYLAGVESALKAYKSILKSKPEAKSKALDDLVSKQDSGELTEFVRNASKACEDTNQT